MAGRYLPEIKKKIRILQSLGMDVGLRNAAGLWGLTSKDESYDYSVLYTPRELYIYLTGFAYAWYNKGGVIRMIKPEPSVDSPQVDSQPVVKEHDWKFYMNGTYCTRCNAPIGSGLPCR